VRKTWAVLRREFVERVRTKWFWVSALLVPLLYASLFVVPALLLQEGGPTRIAVVDSARSTLGDRVTRALEAGHAFRATRVPVGPGIVDSLLQEVSAKRLDGVLLLTGDVVARGAAEYRAANVSFPRDLRELERVLGDVVTAARLERAGVAPALLERAARPITLTTKPIAGTQVSRESAAQSFSLAYVMGILQYMAILMYGVTVKSSVLEEKTTRVVEVLVSSVRPFALLLGKVLGVGAASLFQLAIWGVAGAVLVSQRGILTAFAAPTPGTAVFQVPQVSAAMAAIFLVYFLGGFFLYAAMFGAVGAMSSSEQEAQQAQQPIVWVLMFTFLFSIFALLNDPNSSLSRVLSLVPFTSPITMPVRWAAGPPPAAELATSLVALAAGIVAVTWVAARIYRVGILMTGKRPSLRELVRWVRAA